MICGNNLNYGLEHFIDVKKAMREMNRADWDSWIRSIFTKKDAEELIRLRDVAENNGEVFKLPLELKHEQSKPVLSTDVRFIDKTVREYLSDYGGNPKSDSEDIQTNANTELVFALVYNPLSKEYFQPNDLDPLHMGYNQINYKLREMRKNLADNLVRLLNITALQDYNYNFDDDFAFTSYINLVLAYAQNEIIKKQMRGEVNYDIRTAFIKLACFDELILASGFVQYNPNADITNVLSKDRYTFTGETIDYGKSMFEEHADSEDYTSKLIKIILDSIDCLDYQGNSTVKLGLKGFNEAMSVVVNWAKSGVNPTAFNLITDPDNRNYAEIIRLYLNGRVKSRTIRFALNGILKYLFAEDTPTQIKQMFNAQSDSTVKAVYLEYSIGSNKTKVQGKIRYSPAIVVKEATGKILEKSKAEMVDTILMKLNYLNSDQGSKQKASIKTNYQVSFVPGQFGKSSTLTFTMGSKKVNITYNINENKFTIEGDGWDAHNPGYNTVWAKFLNELLDLPLMNEEVYEFLKKESLGIKSLFDAFSDNIAATMWCLFASDPAKMPFKNGNEWKRGRFYKHVDQSAIVMNRILGDELSVLVTDQFGNKLPMHQMVSLAYRTSNLIADIRRTKDEGHVHVLSDNLFVSAPDIIADTVLRESVSANSRIKKSSELNTSEVLQLSQIVDFYNSLKNEKSIYIQPMTYSDKSRHLLYKLDLKKVKFGNLSASTVFEKISESFGFIAGKRNAELENNENLIYEEIRKRRYSVARKALVEKINRFSRALNLNLATDTDENILSSIATLEIAIANEPNIEQKFYEKGVDFYQENDIDRDGKINKMAVHQFVTFATLDSTKDYFKQIKIQYIKDLIRSGYEMNRFLDPSLKSYYNKLNYSERQSWINSNSGTMSLFKFRDAAGNEIVFDENLTDEQLASLGEVELNPLINGHFLSNALFGEQLRTLQMGADFNIASKGKDTLSDIESRFIAESKRAMGQGSTVLKFDTTRKFGTSSQVNISVYDDLIAPVYNPQGDDKDELVADGGGYISPFQAILEAWSLPGNSRLKIDVVKSILQCIDENGCLNQIKWAGTTISNRRRRDSPHNGDISLETMFRKMHSKKILVNFDVSRFYGEFVHNVDGHSITCSETLYFKCMDPNSEKLQLGKHYKIKSVSSGSQLNTGTRILVEVDKNGNEIAGAVDIEETMTLDSLAAIHDFFGGVWCKIKNAANGTLEYSEINNEILANIICVHDLKDAFVHYNVNKSSMKVGMHNINPSTTFVNSTIEANTLKRQLFDYYTRRPDKIPTFLNGEPEAIYTLRNTEVLKQLANEVGIRTDLWTFSFNLSHSGVQLDSGHSIEGGKVTEMSQLVNLLIEKGYCTDIVESIYRDIARVTDAGMKRFKENNVRTIISELLVDSLRNTSGNINTITDDFIKQLQSRAKTEGVDLEVPFSTPSIREKFATSVCAAINTAALRRKYMGIGAVQTPSYGQTTRTWINGYGYTYEELIDKFAHNFTNGMLSDPNELFYDLDSQDSNIVTAEYVKRMRSVFDDEGNAVMTSVLPYEVGFEQTFVYAKRRYDINGNEVEPTEFNIARVDDISTYDMLRHSGDYVMYRWNTKPSNLKQAFTYYRTVNGTFTIYDFDEYRASAYLMHPEFWLGTERELEIRNYLEVLGIDFNSLTDQTRKEKIEELQWLLQERLRELDENNLQYININGVSTIVLENWSDGAEVVIDYPYKKIFGIRDSDSLNDILKRGSDFFKERISEKYQIPTNVPSAGYDAILYTEDGEPILIQFGDDSDNLDRLPAENMMVGNTFTKNTGKLRYKGEDLGDSDGVTEFIYNVGGTNYKVLRLENPSKLTEMKKTKLFSEIRYNLSHNGNARAVFELVYKNRIKNGIVTKNIRFGDFVIKSGSKIDKVFEKYADQIIRPFNLRQNERINTKIAKLAEKQNQAFLKSLEAVGTRIPSQTLQSCSKIKIVGFSGSGMNDVYLPRILTWVAGSDYDIDKFFIMMCAIQPDGTLPSIYGIDALRYNPTDLATLPEPTGEEFDVLISNSIDENSTEIVITKADIEAVVNGGKEGLKVLERIIEFRKAGGDLDLTLVLEDNEFITDDEGDLVSAIFERRVDTIDAIRDPILRDKVEDFLDLLNGFSTNDISKYAKSYKEAAERNDVLNGMCRALSTNAVQMGLQTPVSVDKAKGAAETYGQKKSGWLNWDNPFSMFKQQEDNMVGKKGIADVAVANKAFNGISFSFNVTANSLADELIENPEFVNDIEAGTNWVKRLLSICLQTKGPDGKPNGGYISLANIDWRRLKAAADQHPEIRVDFSVSKTGVFNIKEFVENLYNYANRIDVNDLFSNIMSAATDNAKELLLAALNAVGNNIDLYTYLFATGKTFLEAAEIMLSPEFLTISNITKGNIFEHDSHRIRLDNAIEFVQRNGHLPTVDATLLGSILGELPRSIVSKIDQYNSLKNNPPLICYMLTDIRLGDGFKQSFIDFVNQLCKTAYTSDQLPELIKELSNKGGVVYTQLTKKENSKITNLEKFILNTISDLDYGQTVQALVNEWLEYRITIADNSGVEDEFDDRVFAEDDDPDRDDLYNDGSGYTHKGVGYKDASADQLRQVYRYLQKTYVVYGATRNRNIEKYKELQQLTKSADEFAILGRKIFSSNQGMKVGEYESWGWLKSINTAINEKFISKLDSFEEFDFVKFMKDPEYAERMIEQYDKVKENVNILKVVKDSPHFSSMLRAIVDTEELLQHSHSIKLTRDIATKVLDGVDASFNWLHREDGKRYKTLFNKENKYYDTAQYSLSENDWKSISKCVDEYTVLNFFLHLDSSDVTIPISSDQIDKHYIQNHGGKVDSTILSGDSTMKLNTVAGLATFKRWMDNFFIPFIKERYSSGDYNAFTDMLSLVEIENQTHGTKKYAYSINPNIRRARPGEILYKKKADVVNDFNKIMQTPISQILGDKYKGLRFTIGDMFYLYNLSTFKDGGSGFAFLFADAAASGNKSEWVNNFQRYILDLDSGRIKTDGGDLMPIDVRDIFFKVVNSENAWKFKGRFNEKGETYFTTYTGVGFRKPTAIMTNSDFVFETPSIYEREFNPIKWEGFNPYEYFTLNEDGRVTNRKIKATGQEVLHEILNQLNTTLQIAGIKVEEITDEDLPKLREQYGLNQDQFDRMSASRGFVLEGKIFINTSNKVHSSIYNSEPDFVRTLMHELVHIVAANLHYNPKFRDRYYDTIRGLWEGASEDERNSYLNNPGYANKKTTDLMEEFFADKIAEAFATNFSEEFGKKWSSRLASGTPFTEKITADQLRYDVLTTLKEVLKLDDSVDSVDLSQLGGTDVTQICHMFKSALFDFNKLGFNTTTVVLSQTLATIKNQLMNENKIIKDCR